MAATHQQTQDDHDHGHGEHVGHVVPMKLLFGVAMMLLVLTAITVGTAKFVDLGDFNIWLALIIAFTKASLVCMYFMHLRWDSPFNLLVLLSSLAFVVLFIGIALTDTNQYQPDIRQLEVDPRRVDLVRPS